MPQRLTPLEVSLLALDTAHTPGHVGTVHIFDPGPDGLEYERLIALIREAAVPPKPRRATRPTAASRAKRLQGKKLRSSIKGLRQAKPDFE